MFFILKIIGIIILCVFLIVVLALFIALVSKIKYAVKCGNKEYTYFCFDLSYIFGIFKFNLKYKDDLEMCLKIFGKKIFDNKRKKYNKIKNDEIDFENENNIEEMYSEQTDTNVYEYTENLESANNFEKQKIDENYDEVWHNDNENYNEDFDVKRVKISNIKEKYEKIDLNETKREDNKDTKNKESKQKVDLKYFMSLSLKDKKAIIFGAILFAKRFIKAVMPKSVNVCAEFGAGEPDKTGYVLALCGILKGTVFNGIDLKGDFDNAKFAGDIHLAGKFTIGYLLISALMFVKIKPVFKTIILFIKN